MEQQASAELLVVVLDARAALLEDPVAIGAGRAGEAAAGAGSDLPATRLLLPELWSSLQSFSRAFDLLIPEQRFVLLAANCNRVAVLADCYADRIDWPVAKRELGSLLSEPRGLTKPSHIAAAVAKGLCMTMRKQHDHDGLLQARILVMDASTSATDLLSQSTALVNCAFGAQNKNVLIDCLSMGGCSSVALQQAASLTKGRHHVLNAATAEDKVVHSLGQLILPTLLVHFLPGVAVRQALVLTQSTNNLSAVCFCHGKVKELAFVCSCCLGVFCSNESAICPSCATRFRPLTDVDPMISD
eukprot:CAMPEP_0178422734 /NCGR_PEP_ID=MMETSP0689_2-20121128/27327_1 /TAXON_ID=160604 /ORGANISM="Amphidinium massartii, Strain CS-259" /LENGTH=300 /DNA_ID=CAMNT_0020044309 /DNA_START=63 /DNA_END=962 /DNA_ORIENTATION=-